MLAIGNLNCLSIFHFWGRGWGGRVQVGASSCGLMAQMTKLVSSSRAYKLDSFVYLTDIYWLLLRILVIQILSKQQKNKTQKSCPHRSYFLLGESTTKQINIYMLWRRVRIENSVCHNKKYILGLCLWFLACGF